MSHSKLLLTGFKNSQLRWYPCLVIILRQMKMIRSFPLNKERDKCSTGQRIVRSKKGSCLGFSNDGVFPLENRLV